MHAYILIMSFYYKYMHSFRFIVTWDAFIFPQNGKTGFNCKSSFLKLDSLNLSLPLLNTTTFSSYHFRGDIVYLELYIQHPNFIFFYSGQLAFFSTQPFNFSLSTGISICCIAIIFQIRASLEQSLYWTDRVQVNMLQVFERNWPTRLPMQLAITNKKNLHSSYGP